MEEAKKTQLPMAAIILVMVVMVAIVTWVVARTH